MNLYIKYMNSVEYEELSQKIVQLDNQLEDLRKFAYKGKYSNTQIIDGNLVVNGTTTQANAIISGGTIGGVSVNNVAIVADTNANAVPAGLTVSSTGISTAPDGTQSAYVVLSWTANAESNFDHYLVRYKKHSYTYYTYLVCNTNTIVIEGLVPNTSYDFGLAAVNKYGISSAFCTDVTSTTGTDSTAPATVTAGSATGGIQYALIEWTANTETDLASYNIYRSETNNSATGVLIANVRTNYFIDGNRVGGTTYYYWIKAVDTSGNVSAAFSTVKSATPRNVTSDDIVTIAGSKVLIDGAVYLSNWRKSGDLTKIDGGSISANTITTTQLNFTPIQGSNVIASINASAEGIKIDADNLTINAATTFGAGYDPAAKVDEVGGSYDSAASGARVRIFPDANTGLQIIDDGGADVFKAIVGGTNVGDVIIGNYGADHGMFYDKSAATFNVKGSIIAGAGSVIAADYLSAGKFKGIDIELDRSYNNTIESYSESNQSSILYMASDASKYVGQSFQNLTSNIASYCNFYLRKYNSPTGNAYAQIYSSSSNVYNSYPETLLATSEAFDVSTLTTSLALAQFTFTGANKITLSANTWYHIVIKYEGGGGVDYIGVGFDNTSPIHAGVGGYGTTIGGAGNYSVHGEIDDVCFYIYKDDDCMIRSGKTDFNNTQSGFILGIDSSDGNKSKFYIGSPTTYLNWDGNILSGKIANVIDTVKIGSDSHDRSTTGTQNIAHGLGKTPKFVKIKYWFSNEYYSSEGVYDGTTQYIQKTFVTDGHIDFTTQSGYMISTNYSGNASNATITVDATNIILNWTKTGSPTGTVSLYWEAIG